MEFPNIYERRKYVMKLIQDGVKFDTKTRTEIGKLFGCSHSAIASDIHILTVKPLANGVFYASKSLKNKIYERDNRTCQYCGKQDAILFIDHVIPMWQGGIAADFNLVVTCASCNTKKKSQTWIPRNFDSITKDNPKWQALILQRASSDKR